MAITNQQSILMRLLSCGTADLEMLEKVNYDLDDIIDDCVENRDLSFNGIYRALFLKAIKEIEDAVVQAIADYVEYTDEQRKEIASLAPCEGSDFSFFVNCLDSHLYLECEEDKKVIYEKYFKSALDDVEDNLGMGITGRVNYEEEN